MADVTQRKEFPQPNPASFDFTNSTLPRLGDKRPDPAVAHRPITRTPTKHGPFLFRRIYYASRHEAACAACMELYIPGFKIKEGINYQVPLEPEPGKYKQVDFRVRGEFFEFHPPRFWRSRKRHGDFASMADAFAYRKKIRSLGSRQEKRQFKAAVRKELAESYALRRKDLIDRDPFFRGTPLITATTSKEFYERVICRFGENVPAWPAFERLFRSFLKSVADTSAGSRNRGNLRYRR